MPAFASLKYIAQLDQQHLLSARRQLHCTASLKYIAQLDQQHLLSARRQLQLCMPASSTSPS
jgi:hypothetical protein